jgi:hypothetical protein
VDFSGTVGAFDPGQRPETSDGQAPNTGSTSGSRKRAALGLDPRDHAPSQYLDHDPIQLDRIMVWRIIFGRPSWTVGSAARASRSFPGSNFRTARSSTERSYR